MLVAAIESAGGRVDTEARPGFTLEKVDRVFKSLLMAALAGEFSYAEIEEIAGIDGDAPIDVARRSAAQRHREWLANNPLPDGVRYYSIIAFPEPERVSWALRNSYLLLGETDVRNDSQLVIFDQFIPGSTVMAVVNADHWAVAVPIQRSHPFVGATFVSRNDYPREAFLEAILRFLEEDLAGEQ